MYEQQIREDIPFIMFYAGVAMVSLLASCYLLFRRGNAFASGVTTPVRLRRCTAAFFASIGLSHVWYVPVIFLTSPDQVREAYLIGGLLDSMTVLPLALLILTSMLQDRKRPMWPVPVMVAPIVMGLVLCIITHDDTLLPLFLAYLLLLGIGIIIYMIHEVRVYGRWLRDNYADLEYKEVWKSFVVLAVILLAFIIYLFDDDGPSYRYVVQSCCLVLIGYLLWRVETLSDLSLSRPQLPFVEEEAVAVESQGGNVLSETVHANIGSLLKLHCIDTKLYLQHDLTLIQLAKTIGINRFYLSQYFAGEGMTYNTYINNLRINHFISLYRDAVTAQRPFTAQELARDSGYRSYSTFSLAFKQRMGQNVTVWMHDSNE
ncbi:MAG: helix-turn-helix transcriptional regulator [Prevotella sp.]|nr:helix-turn-helix transcriptional regulator [Prevotella sp.]